MKYLFFCWVETYKSRLNFWGKNQTVRDSHLTKTTSRVIIIMIISTRKGSRDLFIDLLRTQSMKHPWLGSKEVSP